MALISQAMSHFTEPRGEMTLVITPAFTESTSQVDSDRNQGRLSVPQIGRDFGAREAVARVAEGMGVSKNEVYRIWLEISG